MKRSFITLVTAAVLAAAPLASVGYAQNTDINVIEDQVNADLAQNGINGIDTSTLTLKQLQEIKLITGSGGDRQDMQRQIEAVLGRAPDSQSN